MTMRKRDAHVSGYSSVFEQLKDIQDIDVGRTLMPSLQIRRPDMENIQVAFDAPLTSQVEER